MVYILGFGFSLLFLCALMSQPQERPSRHAPDLDF